jgi:XFP N-terminal domain
LKQTQEGVSDSRDLIDMPVCRVLTSIEKENRTVKTQISSLELCPDICSDISAELLHKMDAYWRAANYLSVGQIYLYDNPLLKEPLKLSHVKWWSDTGAQRRARTSSTCT